MNQQKGCATVRAHESEFISAGREYLDACVFFNRFIDAILPLLNSFPSFALGVRSESQVDFAYRSASYRFRVRGGEDSSGTATTCVVSLVKSDSDDECYKEFRMINIAPRVRGVATTLMFTMDGQQPIDDNRAFYHLMGAK
jgi:hypothetical protein